MVSSKFNEKELKYLETQMGFKKEFLEIEYGEEGGWWLMKKLKTPLLKEPKIFIDSVDDKEMTILFTAIDLYTGSVADLFQSKYTRRNLNKILKHYDK